MNALEDFPGPRQGSVKRQFLRFIIVGLANSLFGYSLFALFLYMGLHYSLAFLLATVIGVVFNFKTTGRLVFGSNSNRLIFRFVIVYGTIYILNTTGVKAGTLIGLSPYVSGGLLIIPMAVVAFILNKLFVFKYAQAA